jgi:hypothetical protein
MAEKYLDNEVRPLMAIQTKQLAWFHFQFRIPAEWEITTYSTEDRTGRLEFSTRKGFQARVRWEACRRTPDMETTMSAFLRQSMPDTEIQAPASAMNIKTRNVGIFFVGHLRENAPCQAIAYLEQPKTLIHWAFGPYDEHIAEDVWMPILESFQPNDGKTLRYAMYGMDFQLPNRYLLEDMTVLPANVIMAFESTEKAQATFRRWGMPDLLLQERALEVFYPWFLRTQGCRVEDVEKTAVSGMEAVKLFFEKRGEHRMDRFIGRPWKHGEAWLWYNRDEMRIYAFEQIAPPKVPLLKMTDVFPSVTRIGKAG